MKEKNYIPGPAKAMYATYLGALLVVIYTGFNIAHPFLSGWRYPWAMSLSRELNFLAGWVIVLVSVVYLYYATLGRPRNWNEPLGIFRIIIALLTVWFWLLIYAVYKPYGWLNGLAMALGGVSKTTKIFELFLWIMLLINLIYLYARWVKSERYPGLVASKSKAGR